MLDDLFGREDAVILKTARAKVEQEADEALRHCKVPNDLSEMAIVRAEERLDFDYDQIRDDKVGNVIANY